MPKKTKRKGIPWGPSNALWRWKHRKSKAKALSTRKASSTPKVIRMTKKKTRRYRPRFKARRHHRDTRMPLSAIVGIGTSVFAPPCPGWASPMEAIKYGSMTDAFQSFVRSWTGISIPVKGGNFDINLMGALNPLDFTEAPAWKAMFWTALTTKIVKKVAKQDPLSKIPVLNKFVKFS